MDINKALNLLADRNGSELFVTVGFPPCLKINKQLAPVGNTELTPEHVHKALQSVMKHTLNTLFLECSQRRNYTGLFFYFSFCSK